MTKYFLLVLVTLGLAGCTTTIDTPPVSEPVTTEVTTPATRIFVLGDSLTAGYQLAYEDSYPAQLENKLRSAGYNITVINGGESGDTSEGLKARIDRITADAQSGDIALIVIGGNDGLQGLSTDALKTNLSDVISALQVRGITTIIGGMQIPTNLGETYRTAFADIYPAVASETNSVLIPFILSGVAGIPELNLRDGIHPNATGQAIIAETVFEVVVDIIKN